MHEFKRTNKTTGVYWLKNNLENLRIKVNIKPKDSITTLPKFEDYTNESNTNIDTTDSHINEHSFSWQEKVFNKWELQRYSDVHHCTTENELRYHDVLNSTDYEAAKVFTYIHEDYYLPLPVDKVTTKNSIMDLNSCFAKLNVNGALGRVFNADTSSMGHLFRSEENIDDIGQKWRAMHVVLDDSEYDSESHLIYKHEAILVSLYHCVDDNYLLVSPDTNNLDMNPYCVETKTGLTLDYEYAVELQFHDDEESAEELLMLLKKLNKKWEKKHKHLVNFTMPPLGKRVHYLAFEILSASDFEMDDLYIEFTIKLPEGVECSDPLHGRTHISKGLRSDEHVRWNYGHLIELTIEAIDDTDPISIHLIFEVISTDWWSRYRTEGYSYLPLTLEPGSFNKMLSCSRPEEMDRVEAESRRFFVGGCHLIKDMDVLIKPHLQKANFVYTTTGSIQTRWNVLSHSPLPGYIERKSTPGTSASALLKGAEAVLRQYKRARARLAAATKDLGGRGDGFEDD